MKLKLWQFINAWQTCYGEDMREEYPGFIEKLEEAVKKAEAVKQEQLDQEEACPKCKGELVEAGLHNCWPYEYWVCIKCNQEYTVELVRDWTTIAEED